MSPARYILTGLLTVAALSTNGYAQDTESPTFQVYPDADSSSNPRIPCIPPVSDGTFKSMDAEAEFEYALAPFVQFPEGGTLEAKIRDNDRQPARQVLALKAGTASLLVRTSDAAKGKCPTLAYQENGKDIIAASGKDRLGTNWADIQLTWDGHEAKLLVKGKEPIVLALPKAINPKSVEIRTSQVESLGIKGLGSFSLNWQNGYAATVVPREASTDLVPRLFGFDAYVVSQNPAKRDYPMLQVLNGQSGKADFTINFSMQGENSGARSQWTQQIHVPARSSTMIPIQFSAPLKTDVYHLEARAEIPAYLENRHFMYVESRPEPSSSAKFGLHDSNRNTFGFWPDALPIPISHVYARWGYIQGPAWQASSGVGPETPANQWNWNPKVEWAIAQGLIPYVCIQSTPYAEWMRDREYPKMKKYPWGLLGGHPRLDLYQNFVTQLMARYKGTVKMYEVENEPNSHLGGMPPEDYIGILKIVSDTAHQTDQGIQVFGICGTGEFIPWIKSIFGLGGASLMEGISLHTYVTPRLPEESNLPAKLAEVKKLIEGTGKPLHWVNSETGTYVALREEVEHPISPDRLDELIKQGIPNLSVARGWPNHAIDEWQGGISIARNVVYNFLAGAESFTFFGWNDQWPQLNWWDISETASGGACFAMISASKDGKRTPSLCTLAVGVLTEQLKGAILPGSTKIDQGGVAGGVFRKTNGGEVAVLWSPLGKRSVIIETRDANVEVISLLGQPEPIRVSQSDEKKLFRLELGEEPVYLHVKEPGIQLLPSPIINLAPVNLKGQTSGFQFTLVNKNQQPWKGTIVYPNAKGWKFTPPSQAFDLKPGERVALEVKSEAPAAQKQGAYSLDASLNLSDGTPFTFPLIVAVRPTLSVPVVPTNFAWDQLAPWSAIASPMALDQAEQAVIGRPPLLSSLQEEKFWKGPTELSGETRVAANAEALFVFLKVKDANFAPPHNWPSVQGSTVELFLDTRSTDELGQAIYTKGAQQLILKPKTAEDSPQIWQPNEKFGKLEGLSIAGGPQNKETYWIALRIPWTSLGAKFSPGMTFGFDVGINGASPEGKGRKTQLMLFGSAANAADASGFAMATIRSDANLNAPAK